MKKILLPLLTFASIFGWAQTPEEFAIEIEPLTIATAPGVHSYSFGQTTDHKWVIIGGRIDGLHQRQPFAAFLEQDNNKNVFVIDPITEEVWSSDLSVLSDSLFEQLQSTNQNFQQRDTMLYIIGGYGRSNLANDHVTFPNVTAVSLDELSDAVINQSSIVPFFRQIVDTNLKVTGGQLALLDDTFYLVGGQLFDGRYNPMGPDHGPGFVQKYTNEIRTFNIDDDGVNLSISNFTVQTDTINLHRRDYNMTPQIFPNGDRGFTAWSGVFDYSDLPYLNSVDITPAGYTVNNTFNQYLSQYHSAKLPVFDSTANTMHTIFFGGMSQFQLDSTGNLVEDQEVPFVRTISRITRYSDGSMSEIDLGYIRMPTLVGAGAEFIPIRSFYNDDEILKLNPIPQNKTLVGYIFGGIESTAANIFFSNDGTQSSASNVIFKVFINKSTASLDENELTDKTILNLKAYPNPYKGKLNLEFFSPKHGTYSITMHDAQGKMVYEEEFKIAEIGTIQKKLNPSKLESGSYFLRITDGIHVDSIKIIKK